MTMQTRIGSLWLAFALMLGWGCAEPVIPDGNAEAPGNGRGVESVGGNGGQPGSGGSAAPDAGMDSAAGMGGWAPGTADAGADAGAARPLPTFSDLQLLCKLINNRDLGDPTGNDTHHRFNLTGTDLGIPVKHGSDLYFFFGDSAGYNGIWPLGPESLPDAVGYSEQSADNVAQTPEALCTGLRFLALQPADSVGPKRDSSIQRDFAGGWMNPPLGHSISEFVHNPAGPRGTNLFPNLPGDFEVPSGAFSHDSNIYVFYTRVQLDPLEMKGSYLARWSTPSTSAFPEYDILYHMDQRFNTSGALRGDFINIAPIVEGEYLYVFGTGAYRKSPVHLARKHLSTLEDEGGFESFDESSGTWGAGNAPAAPVVESDSIGELSVQYFPNIDRYVMLNQEIAAGNFIMARFADRVEGPWSAPIPVARMEDPAFAQTYCCFNGDCSGQRLFNCGSAGFYGTYMLPDAIKNSNGSFSITFTMSTWDPYNVALMQATFN